MVLKLTFNFNLCIFLNDDYYYHHYIIITIILFKWDYYVHGIICLFWCQKLSLDLIHSKNTYDWSITHLLAFIIEWSLNMCFERRKRSGHSASIPQILYQCKKDFSFCLLMFLKFPIHTNPLRFCQQKCNMSGYFWKVNFKHALRWHWCWHDAPWMMLWTYSL